MEEPLTENLNLATSQLQGFQFEDSYCLVVMSGPEKGAILNIRCEHSTLGRSANCTLPVMGKGISRTHASIRVSDEGMISLSDQDSTNGTFVQGVRVREAKLNPGDVFGLGPELKLRVESTNGGLHELIQEMYNSAKIDALTGLLNRRAFEERMDEEFSVAKRHGFVSCLAILDIDHFKSVNDTRGHDAGDEVLRKLSSILKDKVRVGDIVGRWGGEEFVIYVRQAELPGAKLLIERLREMVAETKILLPTGDSLSVTFSAGIVSLQDSPDWRHSLTLADEALYVSKENGRNRVTEVSPIDNA